VKSKKGKPSSFAKSIPEKFINVENSFLLYAAESPQISCPGLIRWLDVNFDSLLINQDSSEEQVLSKNYGLNTITENMINLEVSSNAIDGASAEETMSDSNTDTKFEVWPVRKGIEMKFARSQLENVQLLTCKKLNLSVKCGKCKNIFEFANLLPTTSKDNDKQAWSACPNCNQMAGLRFRSGWIHQSSNSLGFLDTSNASPVDLRPSEYILTCDSCLNECDSINDNNKIEPKNISNKNCFELILNTRKQINCRNCHARMAVTLMDFSFTQLVPGFKLGETKSSQAQISKALEKVSEAKKKKAGAINSNLMTYGLTIGSQLPNKGSCKHYIKSYRWFRFPCCLNLYPCDVCHDIKEQHDHILGKSMVCGYCSKEQSISKSELTGKCINCGNSFYRKTSVESGAYWEGGKGVRDKSKLSKNDPRKYKGLGKTISNKKSSK
ncbi:hypothetical protein AYI69_g6445, partial [Smittium culicis]